MKNDEQAIRQVIEDWFAASKAGNLPAVLDLMTDDVVFMVPGQKPFGKKEFAAAFKQMEDIRIEGTSAIQEIRIFDDRAFLRNHIEMSITPAAGGIPVRRSGYTLTIMSKGHDGRWRLERDANLMLDGVPC